MVERTFGQFRGHTGVPPIPHYSSVHCLTCAVILHNITQHDREGTICEGGKACVDSCELACANDDVEQRMQATSTLHVPIPGQLQAGVAQTPRSARAPNVVQVKRLKFHFDDTMAPYDRRLGEAPTLRVDVSIVFDVSARQTSLHLIFNKISD
jgi:hypothetical protein